MSTLLSERNRQVDQSTGAVLHKTIQQKYGIITEVHEKLPMVKVEYSSGALASGGRFISVNHSVLDILQRFGTLRKGLRVLVTFSGEQEQICHCEIVGVEEERNGAEPQQIENQQTPLYSIFTPGAGF